MTGICRPLPFLYLLLVAFAVEAADELPELKVKIVVDTNTDRRPASTAFPGYPSVARRDRIEGDATVCFRVDARGRISDVSIKEYSNRIFRRPAIRAIKKSSFEPLLPGQVLAKAKTCRTYRFRLEPVVADTGEKVPKE